MADHLYVDVGDPQATTFIAGMGRSGTTWVGSIVNHDFSYRVLFEPFRPAHVPAAAVFGPFAYVRPSQRDPARVQAAESILSGHTPRGTVDRDHRGWIFRRRIVKEVRCNLMLGWLGELRPRMPLVLVVRNPFAVAASWVRLDWGMVAGGQRAELDVILEQHDLISDFPEIEPALAGVNRADVFERVVIEWCLLHLVPLRQLRGRNAHVVRYEDLVREPHATVRGLADYLGRTIDGPSLERALATMKTNFLHRGSASDHEQLLGDWRSVLSPAQVERGRQILTAFGLAHLYDEDGFPTSLTPRGTLPIPGPGGA
jgi:hypothetical protein